jgi:hypothetical protein
MREALSGDLLGSPVLGRALQARALDQSRLLTS